MARWHFCNVFQTGAHTRRLWQFTAAGNKFHLHREETKTQAEPLNRRLVGRDWHELLQPKLNVAWLPAREVFLRVIHLPKADPDEIASMVELQLEKISPIPLAQIVWSFAGLNQSAGDLQTIVVVVVARHVVEQFLGELETTGFLPDRLELPFLDQLRSTTISEDGVWVYPGFGPESDSCLIAWWSGGILRNLNLLHVPPGEQRVGFIQENLNQTAWVGELEGWLVTPPTYHLVASAEQTARWSKVLQAAAGQEWKIVTPIPEQDLAALTARRAVQSNGQANLLPQEYSERYRQQFIDRLWMRGLGAVVVLYLVGVLVYFGFLQFYQYRFDKLNRQSAALAVAYTNALQVKANVEILEEQQDLQYAALDCYKAASENLPAELVLDSLNFQKGRTFRISGKAGSDDGPKVTEYNQRLKRVTVNSKPLFKIVNPPTMTTRGNEVIWGFDCELNRSDNQ